jgi:hypothetical protein
MLDELLWSTIGASIVSIAMNNCAFVVHLCKILTIYYLVPMNICMC